MFRRTFWQECAERAVKSAAQALLGLWALDGGFNAIDANWHIAGGVALGAVVLSLLSSLISSQFGPQGSPSLVETAPTVVTQESL